MKKSTILLTSALLATAAFTGAASAATSESCFQVKYGAITGYDTSCGSSVDIPSTINGKMVWGIADEAFANKGITSVNIPSSVTDIGNYSFYGNSLTSVNLPSTTLGIGTQAFAFNRISSASIPSGITAIAEGAFDGNCLQSNSVLDNFTSNWKSNQTCGGTASPSTPQPEVPTPQPNNPQPNPNTGNSGNVVGNILFPNFRAGAEPAVLNLDDPKLDGMRAQFGATVQSQNNSLTRGEFLRIVIDTAGVDVSNVDMSNLANYKDVSRNSKYAKYVAYASANKIVSGYSDGTFRPNGNITRDEATKILVQATGVQLASSQWTFADITPDNTLGVYVQTAYDNKLVNGVNTRNGQLTYGNRPLFAPKKTISKGELFKIVYNIANAR